MSSDPNELGKGRQGALPAGHASADGASVPGDFTAIFAALGDSGIHAAEPAAIPEDDEFARLFQTAPVKPTVDTQPAPPAGTTSPQASFVERQAVAVTPAKATTPGNATEPYGRTTDDATLIFEALPSSIAPPADMPSAGVPPTEESARTAWAAGFGGSSIFAEPTRMEHTRTPSPVVPADAPFMPQAAKTPPMPAPPVHSSEFTQVFTPLAPPAKPVPPPQSVSASSPAGGGEFTQFFSAISAREEAAKPIAGVPAPTASARVSAPMVPALPALQRTVPVPFASGTAPAQPHQGIVPPTPNSDDFTQLFREGAHVSPPEVALPQTMAEAPASPASPIRAEPSFTQVFQQIQPPSSAVQQPVRPVVGVTPPAPVAPPNHGQGAFREEGGWAAFGAPTQGSGSFTDVFAAQPSSAAAASRASVATPATHAGGDGFTALFQTPVQSASGAASPFDSLGGSPAPPPQNAASLPMPGSWPIPPAPSQAEPLAGGGGDFTKLMQSLGSPAQGQSLPATGSPFGAGGSFFAAPAANNPGGGESEYTRVLRGSSQRDSVAPPAPKASLASNGPAPGMALESPKQPDGEKKAEPKKSKTLVILLVVMNVLLVLALIVIGIVVLKRH